MSKVQIDDYKCEKCGKTGMAELDVKSGHYESFFCDCASYSILQKEAEQLYKELTAGWKDGDKRFRILNELIETEIELEGYCNG